MREKESPEFHKPWKVIFFCLISQSQIHIGVLGFHFLIDLRRLAAKNFFLLKFVGFAGFFVGWVVGVFVARCTE